MFEDNSVTSAKLSADLRNQTPAFKNRIINGDMRIDQRNNGAAVTQTAAILYTLDRWFAFGTVTSKFTVQRNAGSITPPAGFTNYLGVTSTAATAVGASEAYQILQRVEGLNIADFAWGTANAQTVTLSFWVRSSLTGAFGGSIGNSANNRSYPFSYTITAADTWEQKSVTIPGDTTGTWLTSNGVGLYISFGLGVGSTFSGTAGSWSGSNFQSVTGATSVVGTNGATFYITGVQLEEGSTATSFDVRPYGTELDLCQRYYYRVSPGAIDRLFGLGWNSGTTSSNVSVYFPTTMRSRPTALEQTGTASNYSVFTQAGETVCSAVPAFSAYTTENIGVASFTVASGLTAGQGSWGITNSTDAYLGWSAEL
jgi:hypothetical protein